MVCFLASLISVLFPREDPGARRDVDEASGCGDLAIEAWLRHAAGYGIPWLVLWLWVNIWNIQTNMASNFGEK